MHLIWKVWYICFILALYVIDLSDGYHHTTYTITKDITNKRWVNYNENINDIYDLFYSLGGCSMLKHYYNDHELHSVTLYTCCHTETDS